MIKLEENPDVLSFEISVNGQVLDSTVEIISIQIEQELNRISSAMIRISDGGAFGVSNELFSNSDGEDFVPGNDIEISLGYGDKRKSVFKGIVLSQRLMVKKSTSYLQILCKDKAFLLTKSRSNMIMDSSSDDELFKSLASKAGVSIESASAEKLLYPLVQHNSTDWDYLVIRSEISNFYVVTDSNKLVIKKFDFSESAVANLSADSVAIEVDLDLNGENLYSDFEFNAWDSSSQEIIQNKGGLADGISQGNLSAVKIASDLNMPAMNKYASAELVQSELVAYTNSWISKTMLSKIQGKIKVPGTSSVKVGELIELSNFSKRFNGKAFVSKIINQVEEGSWLTTLFLGMNSRWHSSLPDIEDDDAIGLLPAARGMQIGKVKKIDADPSDSFRVQVELPTSSNADQKNTIWARIAFPYASSDAGFFFFPEIGDEVLISFLGNDPRFPVITGSLYSPKNVPKHTPSEKNEFKSIFSKSGISITFDDDKKILTAETPGGHSAVFSDDDKSITLKDSNGNEFVLNDSGVKISSVKDITLDAQGSVSISANQDIKLSASGGDLKGEGLNVEMSGQIGFKGKGSATAELSASGQTTVKGSIVMIN
ncbi:phage baseplate assembly protein V [Algoriphagus aquimarinus]|uniref:Gp5/Type VI secretion system Vgr protein OB-fold domain-containing protein n=1 Tax=Algoriphagus aquimarinus TaxID=237018 RepID=A0A1I1BSK1_9BACT|nr:phage baseplate assembly protein V [Algoriphagus aquimarinus]SFB53424.1 hypothetical protein SAMN04489723_11747 [Algoriphagus aquimarinus]